MIQDIKDYWDFCNFQNDPTSGYAKFMKWPPVLEFFNSGEISLEEFNMLFPNPFELHKEEPSINECGDELTVEEFQLVNKSRLCLVSNFGWLQDDSLRNELINSKIYSETFKNSYGKSERIRIENELNALHILGRCNSPSNWSDSSENKQGLVYGMVQSGKTANMLNVVALALATEYNLFIILGGDKDSLRNQTQNRIDNSFKLQSGISRQFPNLRSITLPNADYLEVSRGHSALDVWGGDFDGENKYFVCIKKEINNLEALVRHMDELCIYFNDSEKANPFKCLIIDDEADFGSQDTARNQIGTPLHNSLVKLRKSIPLNCYIAYTATPQACISADPSKIIGYPKDFIWLLEPFVNDNGDTESYLGLEEYFIKYPEFLTYTLKDNSWPYYTKDVSTGKKLGLYNGNGEIVQSNLIKEEKNWLLDLISKNSNDSQTRFEFKTSLADFIVGGAIRWYRHYLNCKHFHGCFLDKLPIQSEVLEINQKNDKATKGGFPEFPYHAMMVNVSQLNETQSLAMRLFEELTIELTDEFRKLKFKQEHFAERYNNQLNKSDNFSKHIPAQEDLIYFVKLFLAVLRMDIYGSDGRFIYLLNSQDEGQTLKYSSLDQKSRPKKATLVVGGNILARGLTIENLSVAVYCRSQVISLGDTNLQMCRWFGHKRDEIDLLSVYYQKHSQLLFKDIASADKQLRSQFKKYINDGDDMECVLLSLFNSPLFKVTSPSKSRLLVKAKKTAFSGLTVDNLEPFKNHNYYKNYKILNDFFNRSENFISSSGSLKMMGRAKLYFDVGRDELIAMLKSLHFDNGQLNYSINDYCDYLEAWLKEKGELPTFNVAIFGEACKDGLLKRKRKTYDFNLNEEKNAENLIEKSIFKLNNYRGGRPADSRKSPYLGDIFVDYDQDFHTKNYSKNFGAQRTKGMPILFMFYLLDGNYIGQDSNKNDVFIPKTSEFYLENISETNPLVTLSISTPNGGPKYDVYSNKLITLANCQERDYVYGE
jgi:hypothetical protein